jgi:hypothetical protein
VQFDSKSAVDKDVKHDPGDLRLQSWFWHECISTVSGLGSPHEGHSISCCSSPFSSESDD